MAMKGNSAQQWQDTEGQSWLSQAGDWLARWFFEPPQGRSGSGRRKGKHDVCEVDLEGEFLRLASQLKELPVEMQRAVQSLLGLIVGDSVGLPYELRGGIANRGRHDKIALKNSAGLQARVQDSAGLQASVQKNIHDRLLRNGANNFYARSFSDDTVIADLKMSSVTHCAMIAKGKKANDSSLRQYLWKLQLAGLLAWSFGKAKGKLFQGAGGFTKGWLRPSSTRRRPCGESSGAQLPGFKTWPKEWFIDHSRRHLSEQGGSWGNGTVMSYAPQVLAERIEPADNLPCFSADALDCLADAHQHVHARYAHKLLHEILEEVLAGHVQSCRGLAKLIRSLPAWKAVKNSEDLSQCPAYPLRAFEEFLRDGDCSEETMLEFVREITGLSNPSLAGELHHGYMTNPSHALVGVRFGQLLRTLSNWNDDNKNPLQLPCGEGVRFSQRGLNSVIVAIWCCCRAESTWDWISRLLYVGGDTDTIGAICGQIASPLFPCDDILEAFGDLAAVGIKMSRRRLCVDVAAIAALRYFERSLLFCKGHWVEHARGLRLVDPSLVDSQRRPRADLGHKRGVKRRASNDARFGASGFTKRNKRSRRRL